MADKTTINDRIRRDVLSDLADRQTWARKQDEIARRRLSARKTNKTKPYKGAPNFVEPIIDDNVTEKTDQEISMLLNAPVMAHAIPMTAGLRPDQRSRLEYAFDYYLRHIITIRPILEEGVDTKNERGFTVFKKVRSFNNRLDQDLPGPIVIDPKDIIVPKDTKDVQDAERLVHVIRLTPLALRNMVRKNGWNKDAADEIIRRIKSGGRVDNGSDEESIHDVTSDLTGIATSDTYETNTDGVLAIKNIVIWETYRHATEEDQKRDSELIQDRRMVTVFCPDVPDVTIAEFPWRTEDEFLPMPDPMKLDEIINARGEGREPDFFVPKTGKDRLWPFVQNRYESRSSYWYEVRGIGEKTIDNQIKATQMQNAKAVLVDYYSAPLYTGDVRNSGNISFRPGSKMPGNFAWVQPPQIPSQFDFDINQDRATASKRAATQSQNLFSADVGSQKIEKTATEVEAEGARVNMVSSASVDRFNTPMGRLFQLIWEDLRELKPDIPIIINGQNIGEIEESLYDLDIVWVPASSAKTLNPDIQLRRSINMANFALSLQPLGLPIDPNAIWATVSSYWDANLTADWVIDPNAAGPQGQPPIYQILEQLQQQNQALGQAVQEIGQNLQSGLALSQENAESIAKLEQNLQILREQLRRQNATSAPRSAFPTR